MVLRARKETARFIHQRKIIMTIIKHKEILNLGCNLSPSQLSVLDISNKNIVIVENLLDRKLKLSDKGSESGSVNYVSQSSHYFIRAKALQSDYFLPFLNSETAVAIRPQVFKNFNLREGDLVISKDANIGEAAILDQDYPNYTISGALYRLPISKNKLYLLAFFKHHYFREQLNLLVPRGSTIRHAKTLFLDCKIPFPNQKNANEVMKYVELLTQVIINKEKEIRKKDKLIFKLIEEELENQKKDEFKYKYPNFSELILNSRINSGYYCYDYKRKFFLISNYKNGYKAIDNWGFKMIRGQNLKVRQIGRSIYSDKYEENFYSLVTPAGISEFGTVKKLEYLGNPKKLSQLKVGDIIFSSIRTIGKCALFDNANKANLITNNSSIILRKENHNIKESAFIVCFLRFLRSWGIFDYISVAGPNGSLAYKYWKDNFIIPEFSKLKQQEISSLYYNPAVYPNNLNLEIFLEKDQKWNEKAGIIEIDESIKKVKENLNKILDKIINDEEVEVDFNF